MIDQKTFSTIISDLEAYLERAKSYSKTLEEQGDLVGVNELKSDLRLDAVRLECFIEKLKEICGEAYLIRPMKERKI